MRTGIDMRITIAAIGKLKDHERDLVTRYAERFDGTGRRLALGPLKIAELSEGRAEVAAERKRDEAERLARAAAGCDYRAVLDEKADQLSSAEFARRLARLRDDGVQHLAFFIGGADGHSADFVMQAPWKLSLGAMTLPHGFARLILAEQLYRAATILSGHPYHRA